MNVNQKRKPESLNKTVRNYYNTQHQGVSHVSRILSAIFDSFIMSFIVFIPIIAILSQAYAHTPTKGLGQIISEPFVVIFSVLLGILVYFNKDFFGGQSIGKRVFKLQVVVHKTGHAAGPFRCLVRNFTLLLGFIELILTLVSPKRRLGDFIAGTRIEAYDETRPNSSGKLRAAAIMLGLLYLISIPIAHFIEEQGGFGANYVASSYNDTVSTELTGLIMAKFTNKISSINLKLYNEIEGDSVRYISLKTTLSHSDIFDNEFEFDNFTLAIRQIIDKQIGEESYILSAKLKYENENTWEVRTWEHMPTR